MENECEALPGVAYPGVRDNRSTINTKTGYDDDDDVRRLKKQLKLTAIIQSRRLTYLGILCAWMTTQMPRGSC